MNELVNQAKKGDPDAFTELMRSQMQNMYKAARAILNRDEDVADAISDTILACWEHLGSLKQAGYFRTWMTRILINKCYEQIRKNKPVSVQDQVPDYGYWENKYENIEWTQTLDSLPQWYRLVMILYYVEGFKINEISKMLDMPKGTVKSRLARGREYLADSFKLCREGN